MKILMFSHAYPPVISGVSLVVQKLAREMVTRGHQTMVVTASDDESAYEAQDEGVAVIRVRSAPNPFWSEGRLPLVSHDELQQIIAGFEPDVINTHDSGLLGVQLSRLEYMRRHVPELLTCHYLPRYVTHYINAGDAITDVLEALTWKVSMRLINGFDHVIFPTRTQQQAFIEEGLVPPSTVVSNGLNIRRYHPDGADNDVVSRYNLPSGPRILMVGRIAKDKMLDVPIRAMQEIVPVHPAHLLFVGRGNDRERLEGITHNLGLENHVHFLGFVPEEDLPAIYRQSDIFTIASDVEVQSIPTLQAAATGLPIVAAKAAALPELVKDPGNGRLVPPGNPTALAQAICEILDDPDLAKRMGHASLEIGRHHAEEHTIDAYEGLYRAYSQRLTKYTQMKP